MKIYKFAIEITDMQKISLPGTARILSVSFQDGIPCIWVLMDDSEYRERNIAVVGTGNEIPSVMAGKLDHIGMIMDKHFVWNVFEVLV